MQRRERCSSRRLVPNASEGPSLGSYTHFKLGWDATLAVVACSLRLCYAPAMTELLENALRKVAQLSREEQDAIAAQIIETLGDETAWKAMLAGNPDKLRRLAEQAKQEASRG